LYAYVEPGEIIEATLRIIPFTEGGPLVSEAPGDIGDDYCIELGQATWSIYCNPGYPISISPESVKVTIYGPNSTQYEAGFPEDFNRYDIIDNTLRTVINVASTPSDSIAPAVWRIKIDQEDDLNMRFRWEVNVMDGSTPKPGRIWTDEVRISQINSKELPRNSAGAAIDLVYWAQRSDGYRYKITQKGYNGFGSVLNVGAFGVGLPEETGCVSAYGSVEIPLQTDNKWGNNWAESWAPRYIPDIAGKQGKNLDNVPKCAGLASYRIFFDEPDPDLPGTPVPDWTGSPVLNLYRDEPTMPQITGQFESTDKYKGYAVIANHDSYYGNAVLELDTSGGATPNYSIQIPFGIADSITRIPLDGTKNNNGGEKIPMGTLVRGRVVLSYLGEIHIISLDIEQRTSGIEVERLNGAKTNQYALFWDDSSQWISAERATLPTTNGSTQFKSALPNGTNSQGGVHAWSMPDTYAGCTETYTTLPWSTLPSNMIAAFEANNIICPFEMIGHWNEHKLQAWGDNRAIEDWTFDIDRTALLQQQVRDDSYFEYMFVDCSVTDAQFEAYIAYLQRKGASEATIAAAWAERVACPSGPNPQPSCDMGLTGLIGFFGDEVRALEFWETYCDSGSSGGGGGDITQPPKTGGQRYYFY